MSQVRILPGALDLRDAQGATWRACGIPQGALVSVGSGSGGVVDAGSGSVGVCSGEGVVGSAVGSVVSVTVGVVVPGEGGVLGDGDVVPGVVVEGVDVGVGELLEGFVAGLAGTVSFGPGVTTGSSARSSRLFVVEVTTPLGTKREVSPIASSPLRSKKPCHDSTVATYSPE